MDTSIIEKTATNIVEREILKYSECLSPYINSNDKTPVWDGNIYIYSSSEQTVEKFKGKIDVQVKGRYVEQLNKGNSKYSISINQLKAYRNSLSGTLLILVEFIDQDNFQMYYANLLPVDLYEIFNDIKEEQQNKTLTMKPIVPKSSSSLKFICLNFLENSNRQANRRCISLEEMSEVEKINFKVINERTGVEEYILNNTLYTYGVMKDTGEIVNLPILKDIKRFEKIKLCVNLDNEELDLDVTRTFDSSSEKFLIGNSIEIDENACKLNYIVTGNLNNRIKDLKILMYIFEYKYLKTNTGILSFPLIDDEINRHLKSLKKMYDNYIKVKEMLSFFNISSEINFEEYTDNDLRNLYLLLDLYRGINLDVLKENKIYAIKFDEIIVYLVPKIESGRVVGIYNLFGNFVEKVKCFATNDKGAKIPVSIYYTLDEDCIKSASNFNASVVLRDVLNVSLTSEISTDCNLLILKLVSAYDDTGRPEFLQLASDIEDYLLEFEKNDLFILNYYQIKYRKNGLDINDKKIIKEIYDRGDNFTKCGAAKLLNNNSDFDISYDLLTADERERLDKSPIINVK